MVLRRGDRRVLAVAAGGTHVIYVVLTCVFYFVGLAYENVSEVTRFILFLGAIDCAMYAARRAFGGLLRIEAPYVAAENQVPFSA